MWWGGVGVRGWASNEAKILCSKKRIADILHYFHPQVTLWLAAARNRGCVFLRPPRKTHTHTHTYANLSPLLCSASLVRHTLASLEIKCFLVQSSMGNYAKFCLILKVRMGSSVIYECRQGPLLFCSNTFRSNTTCCIRLLLQGYKSAPAEHEMHSYVSIFLAVFLVVMPRKNHSLRSSQSSCTQLSDSPLLTLMIMSLMSVPLLWVCESGREADKLQHPAKCQSQGGHKWF